MKLARFSCDSLLPAKIPANKQSIIETPDCLERQLRRTEQEFQHGCLLVVHTCVIEAGIMDVVDHEFPVTGHTYMPVDADFAWIEAKA